MQSYPITSTLSSSQIGRQPHFSERHYNLLRQEVEEAKYSLELKEKKVSYLEGQLKYQKEQDAKRIQILEKSLDDLKKEHNELIRKTIRQKKQDSDQNQTYLRKLNEQHRCRNQDQKRYYENRLEDKEKSHQSLFLNLESKYKGVIQGLKEQNVTLRKMLNPSQELGRFSSNASTHQPGESTGIQEKIQTVQELTRLKIEFEKVSQSLRENELERKRMLMIHEKQTEGLATKLQKQQLLVQEIQSELMESGQRYEAEIAQKEDFVDELSRKVKELKTVISEKDREIFDLVESQSRSHRKLHSQQPQSWRQTEEGSQRQGLIKQLETNIEILHEENSELRERILQWQKMLGYDKSMQERSQQLNNISEKVHSQYKKQRANIKRQAANLG